MGNCSSTRCWRQASPPDKTTRSCGLRCSAERRTVVSNVTEGRTSGRLFAAVAVPVSRNGTVKWALVASLYSKHFTPVMEEPGVPKDWVVSIVDRNGRHMMRSHRNEAVCRQAAGA